MNDEGKMTTDWDARFIDLAYYVARWSKDPSTKAGAVIVDNKRRVMGIGYNGFPRGVQDTPRRLEDRPEKYATIVHADANAILNAMDCEGMTMYTWPMLPCNECAKLIIQSGIVRVIAPKMPLSAIPRWESRITFAAKMMREAGLIVREWEPQYAEDEEYPGIAEALDELDRAHQDDVRQGHPRSETERVPQADSKEDRS